MLLPCHSLTTTSTISSSYFLTYLLYDPILAIMKMHQQELRKHSLS